MRQCVPNEDDERSIHKESFERAAADLEMLCAAYPEEISIVQTEKIVDGSISNELTDEHSAQIPTWFPLIFTLHLAATDSMSSTSISTSQHQTQQFGATVTMEFPTGYPVKELEIVSYRTSPTIKKDIIEKVVANIRMTAKEAVETYGGEECGLAACSTAFECWNECLDEVATANETIEDETPKEHIETYDDIEWISAETTLIDRKSVFQAHLCLIENEEQVNRAMNKLILGSSKIQRATHNMFAYRFIEELEDGREILKHDNDDDGEDAAGSRLAQLLEMRKENGVLIVVSRWYGGVHLGPKRFAHITNVARDLLVECHEKQLL